MTLIKMFYIVKSAIHGSLYLYLCLWLMLWGDTLAEGCSQCSGPTMYYKDLNCKPIYNNSDNCCPIRYDCSHLKTRSPNKCYANGHEYSHGELLRDEDRLKVCDINCRCDVNLGHFGRFRCAMIDCPHFFNLKQGCYFKHNMNSCCGGETICPKSEEDIPKCEVDGKIYSDGQTFYPMENPEMICQCSKDYKGNNIPPFCKKRSKCAIEMRHSMEVQKNCAPVFGIEDFSEYSCPIEFRCQNNNDTILSVVTKNSQQLKTVSNNLSDKVCRFGNMTMQIGDLLDERITCVSCMCEVPPTPTCFKLPDKICKLPSYSSFIDKFS